jgi:uncharacterized protein with PIN domain
MSRIRKFYQQRFDRIGRRLNPPRGAAALLEQADLIARERSIPISLACALLHAQLRRDIGETDSFPTQFVCDAGVGGLARWLRGAGYEAHWDPSLDDAAVIREAQRRAATLITTDSLMMERGILRDGIAPSVFVPSSVHCEDQLLIVLTELQLPLRESRCMRCGGPLRRVEKAEVADRIPPKTALWLDEYFVCARCDQLFWRGTHWRRISEKLKGLKAQ